MVVSPCTIACLVALPLRVALAVRLENLGEAEGASEPLPVACSRQEENPLDGLLETELMSLGDAVKPLYWEMFTEADFIAKANHIPTWQKGRAALKTEEEKELATAIGLYADPMALSLHKSLNSDLRTAGSLGTSDGIRKYFPLLRLLLEALVRLAKPVRPGTKIYRGVGLTGCVLQAEYKVGQLVTWWGFSSCSADRHQAASFAERHSRDRRRFFCQRGHAFTENHTDLIDDYEDFLRCNPESCQNVMFSISGARGYDIEDWGFGNEREVLLLPGTVLEVRFRRRLKDGSLKIALKAVGSVFDKAALDKKKTKMLRQRERIDKLTKWMKSETAVGSRKTKESVDRKGIRWLKVERRDPQMTVGIRKTKPPVRRKGTRKLKVEGVKDFGAFTVLDGAVGTSSA